MHPFGNDEMRYDRRNGHQRERDQFIERRVAGALPRENQDEHQQRADDDADDFKGAESPRHQRARKLLLRQRGESRRRDNEAEKGHRAKPQTQHRKSDILWSHCWSRSRIFGREGLGSRRFETASKKRSICTAKSRVSRSRMVRGSVASLRRARRETLEAPFRLPR